MAQGNEGCEDWLEPRRQGVHDLMVRLLDRCTCQSSSAHVHRLYGIDGTRDPQLQTA